MKKKLFLTTSLCAVILCGAFVGGTSFASAEALDSYPEDFTKSATFSDLRDYAVNGSEYLFLDGDSVYKLGNANYESVNCGEKTVTAVDCKDGVFYYSAGGTIYTVGGEQAEVEIPAQSGFTLNNCYYYLNTSGSVSILDTVTDEVTKLDGFAKLKTYGGKAFAVKENVIYEINGVTPSECKLEYSDYSDTLNIAVGDTADKLKTFNSEAPHFVRLKAGSYLTEIDDGELDETFTAGNTLKVGTGVTAETALLLCKTGYSDGISIVVTLSETDGKTKSQCYMIRTADTTALNRSALSTDIDKSKKATVTVTSGYIYSSPYVCGITQLARIKATDELEILGVVNKTSELMRAFYLVKLTDGSGDEITGYVPLEYVSLYTYESEKEPSETVDPDYSEEDEIKPVVLILIVIALVLIALGYMVFIGTNKKKDDKKDDETTTEKKKKKDKKKDKK